MTREEAIKILKEDGCSDCTWGCESPLTCDNEVCLLPEAINMAIKALEQEIKRDKDCEWGRMTFDVISGISEFEFSDGTIKRVKQAELEPCDDAISRKAVKEALRDRVGKSISECINAIPPINLILCEDAISREDVIAEMDMIKTMTPVTPSRPKGHCKNCKYFEYDSVAKVDGVPLIVAHEICKRWGDGFKTSEDGYCYLFEPQESDHKCHTCKHYTSGERDGSCGSYICKHYSDWESEDKE